ncbi:penicillin acylase family protein [Amycolatopsis sp. NPDC059657]|uniref:penicillin acylase family protein n=1 Tax=Amycolatopsis sp. NPDC059657 TaxID=3346899 RepID=UPI0036710391
MRLRLLADAVRLVSVAARIAIPPRARSRERIRVTVLSEPVEVLRDRWGVPHVYARNRADLFAAQGFLHARDRLWQMELQRRLGRGELAELVGPDALDGDRFARTLGLRRTAEAEVSLLDSATRAAVEAYVRGVNACLGTRRGLPPEFRLLGHRPRPWTAVDVLVWGKALGLSMSGNWASEVLRARIVDALGPDAAARHDLGYLPGQCSTVPAAESPELPADPLLGSSHVAQGSNAWAVSGKLSKHGKPLLACDPHLNISFPAIWYQNHLHAPDFHVTGAGLPGAPGVVTGHNDRIAWGFSNARADVQDLFEERVEDGRYLHGDRWLPLTVTRETISVRRGGDEVVEVRATGHGPLVTEVLGGSRELAFCWTGNIPGGLLPSLLALNAAEDWAAFDRALDGWAEPALNFVYADVDGHIGYRLAGAVPVRADGDGSVPAPGWTGTHEWTGLVAADELPRALDPATNLLVTANNRIEEAERIPGEWIPDYRARRIADLLGAGEHEVGTFTRIQNDVLSLPGLELAGLANRLPAVNPLERAARDALVRWDGELTADSGAGAIYWSLRTALLKHAYADLAGPLGLKAGLGMFTWQPGLEFLEYVATPNTLKRLTAREDDWLPPGRDWQSVFTGAWREALAELTGQLGPDVGDWRYGRLHQLTLCHPFGGLPLLDRLVNRGPFPTGGDLDTVCAGQLGQSADGSPAYSGGAYRQVCDLADWDRSVSVLATGQSGRPGDRHYADLAELWLRAEYHPMLWTRSLVEQETEQRIALEP